MEQQKNIHTENLEKIKIEKKEIEGKLEIEREKIKLEGEKKKMNMKKRCKKKIIHIFKKWKN
jgi:hypothetical protein